MESTATAVFGLRQVIAECVGHALDADPVIDVVIASGVGQGLDAVAVAMQRGEPPEVVVVDERVAIREDLAVLRTMRNLIPAMSFVVLSDGAADRTVVELLRFGIEGYLPPDATVAELRRAVRDVVEGRVVVPPDLLARLIPILAGGSGASQLSEREIEILALLDEGLATKDIAQRMFLSPHTVRGYVQTLLGKLGVQSRLGAVAEARRQGLLDTR